MSRQALKIAFLPYAALAHDRRPGVLILNYHQVGGGDTRQLDMPVELFDWQMRYLADHRHVVPLDEVVRLARGEAPHEDAVVITFDDGYADVYRHAYPILCRYNLPATIYLSTQFIDEQRPFAFGGAERPRGFPLTWGQLAEMMGSGFITIGAHTHSHADLSRMSFDDASFEIAEANRLITERLGNAPVHFAYPWGRVTPKAQEMVAGLYRTAAGGHIGKNAYGAIDLLSLSRIPIQRSDGRLFFRLKQDAWTIPAPSTMVRV